MKPALLVIFLFMSSLAFTQEAHLQVLKNGKVRKRIPEGTIIKLTDKAGNVYIGPYGIINDSNIVIGDVQVRINDMKQLNLLKKKQKKPFDKKRFAYTTLGVVLATAGMTLSKWETFPKALLYSSILGYSSYAIEALTKLSFKKKKFKVSKKKKLRIWTIERYDPVVKPF